MEITVEVLRRWVDALIYDGTRSYGRMVTEMSRAIQTIEAQSSGSDEWFGKLWGAYPKEQHDGVKVPPSTKGASAKRFASTCKSRKVSPETLATACMLYARHARGAGQWVPSLQVLLGNEKCYWENHLPNTPKGE